MPADLDQLSPVWREVAARAEYRREAVHTVRRISKRCEHCTPVRLVVAPRDPAVSEHAAWRVPIAELALWCTPCLTDARSRASRAATARPGPMPGQLGLMEFPSELSVLSGIVTSGSPERGGAGDNE